MKKLLIAMVLATCSSITLAAAPGGPNCGWGNMVFEGTQGLLPHLGATITNGTSGNATFGMTSGTNGCNVDLPLTYSGKQLVALPGFMEEVASDMARGEGDALNALAISFGIQAQDRAHFSKLMNENFSNIFTTEDLSTEMFLNNVVAVLSADVELSQYVTNT